MYKVDDADAAADMPVPTASSNPGWFQEGNPGTGTPATVIRADWLNGITAELLSILTAAAITPVKNVFNQVLLAILTLIQAGAGSSQDDTGAANAYVITPTPAVAAYAKYQTFTFKAAHANTAACTLNVSAVGAVAIVRPDGSALAAGEIAAGQVVTVRYDGAAFQLVGQPTTGVMAALAAAAGFASSLGGNGYLKLPSWLGGFVFQWTTVTSGAPVAVSWPITFPNACYFVFTQAASASTTTYGINVASNTTTGTTAYPNSGGGAATITFGVFAFGR